MSVGLCLACLNFQPVPRSAIPSMWHKFWRSLPEEEDVKPRLSFKAFLPLPSYSRGTSCLQNHYSISTMPLAPPKKKARSKPPKSRPVSVSAITQPVTQNSSSLSLGATLGEDKDGAKVCSSSSFRTMCLYRFVDHFKQTIY